MQVLPQFDPWGQAGQQMGSGIGNYLMQATDRNRFMQNLSAAQQLLQPRQGPKGTMIAPTPSETLMGLLQASGGNPAFLNMIGDIYPHLLKQTQNIATTKRPNWRTRNQGQGQPMPGGGLLPDGQEANVPTRGQRGQRTLGGFQQQGAPFNEQPYAMESGGGGPAGGPDVDQPVMERNVPMAAESQQALPSAGGAQPARQTDLPPQQPPQLRTYTPEMEAEDMEAVITSGGSTESAINVANQTRSALNQENQNKIQAFDLDNKIAGANRTINDEQQAYIDKQLADLGWVGQEPLDTAFNRALSREYWLDAMNNKELNSDAQRWQQVYKRMDRTRNAQTNILSGTGNPWPWEDYETAVKGAKGATKAFIDASGAYNPKTGQYDLIKVNRAIRLNQDNDWSADEAREIAIPLSDRVNSIVRSAPSMNIKEIPKSYEGLTIGDDRYHEKDPKVLSQKYDEIASKLVKNVGPYDSLLVTRRKLFNNGNYNKRDFLEVLERMKGMGFTLSPYHLQEEGLLQEELRLTPGEIFSGYGLRKYFREPRKLK